MNCFYSINSFLISSIKKESLLGTKDQLIYKKKIIFRQHKIIARFQCPITSSFSLYRAHIQTTIKFSLIVPTVPKSETISQSSWYVWASYCVPAVFHTPIIKSQIDDSVNLHHSYFLFPKALTLSRHFYHILAYGKPYNKSVAVLVWSFPSVTFRQLLRHPNILHKSMRQRNQQKNQQG